MQKNIHATWYPDCQVNCACGHKFTTGSTLPKIEVEICSNCHPFYTGTQKFADVKGRIDKFKQKVVKGQEFAQIQAAKTAKSKKKKAKAKKTLDS
jgi:large subunit ribosomal protein L31